MSDTVAAVWNGPFVANVAGVGIVFPGQLVDGIPAGMVSADGHWQPAPSKATGKKAAE